MAIDYKKGIEAVMPFVRGNHEEKLLFGRKIFRAILQSQTVPVKEGMLSAAEKQIASAASDTWKTQVDQRNTRSKGPGPSFPGNDVAQDKSIPPSDPESCTQQLSDAGIDAQFAKDLCEGYGNYRSGTAKNASSNSVPNYIVARDQLFSGGSVSQPNLDNIRSARFNEKNPPAYIQTTYDWRSKHGPSVQAEKQVYEESAQRNASMDKGKPAWLVARERLLGR